MTSDLNDPVYWRVTAISADELLAAGDVAGKSVWLRILRAIEVLQARERANVVH